MTESVSDILVARQRLFENAGVGRPVAYSLGVHTLLIVALALLPGAWFRSKANVPTMVISLGAGSLGVKRSGQISTGGKKVDEVVEPKTHEPILPVAPPKAVTPDPAAPVVRVPPKTADKPATAPPTQAMSKPATGAKITPGSATVETGAKGLEIGLSSAGGGNNSAEMESCCTDYFNDMQSRIDAVWQRNQGAAGEVWVDFVIARDGTISGIHVSKSSGIDQLNLAAERAVTLLKMGPLPDRYTGQRMFMTLKFPYIR
jgi:TonB family protein